MEEKSKRKGEKESKHRTKPQKPTKRGRWSGQLIEGSTLNRTVSVADPDIQLKFNYSKLTQFPITINIYHPSFGGRNHAKLTQFHITINVCHPTLTVRNHEHLPIQHKHLQADALLCTQN